MSRVESPQKIEQSLPENLLLADPSDLMRDNPAALIVNKESYSRMEAHFSPEQLDPPQVVRVLSYSSIHGEMTKLFVVDGLTRTKYFHDHKGTKLENHADFSFDQITVRDVTTALLQNPLISDRGASQNGHSALTMTEYLKAVVPPTVEHSAIVADRIAAHLINGWENMVGEEIAQKYSAIAALSFLSDEKVSIATNEILDKFLAAQDEIMANETGEERVKLRQAFLETASIIRQTKRFAKEIGKAAYELVSTPSAVIGGQREARKEIFGLLHTPEVGRKLKEFSPDATKQEQMRYTLGQALTEAFLERYSGRSDRPQILKVLGEAIQDSNLTLDNVRNLLISSTPLEEYNSLRQDKNKEILVESYREKFQKKDLNSFEEVLLRNLGKKTYLDTSSILTLTKTINLADSLLNESSKILLELNKNKADLQKQGVNFQTLEDGISQLERSRNEILTADTAQSISRRLLELKEVIRDLNERITFQKNYWRLSQLSENPLTVDYLLSSQDHLDISDESQVKLRLEELGSFDADIQNQVILGSYRLSYARQIQRDRKLKIENKETEVLGNEIFLSTQVPVPTKGRAMKVAPIATSKIGPEERRRIEGNRKITEIVNLVRSRLAGIDIDPKELTDDVKREFDAVINEFGRIRFGHLDIVRIIEKDYPQLREDLIARREVEVQREIDVMADLTKTSQ